LETQLPLLKANLDSAEGAFNKYQLKKGTVDLSAETQALLERAVDLEKTMSELELRRTELRQRFTDDHPNLVALQQKLDRLRAERGAMNHRMKGLPEQELDSARLTRDVKVATELYFLLLNKAQELRVVKSGTIGNVRILDSAVLPYEPARPKKLPVLAVSVLFGLAGGMALAFARKALDQGVDDPEQIEAATGLSIYASVPHSDKQAELMARRRRSQPIPVLAAADPNDLSVESLRSLRTSLQFALLEAENNIITIGGPSPGIGKSFLSVNLAFVLAASGKRVLLIDADLRRGRLHRYFGGERDPGISDVVSGALPLGDALRPGGENLDFLATGRLPPNPSEVVGSQRFESLLRDLAAKYDLVIVDTPPILAVTDTSLIGRFAGVNLLALRAGQHPMREITLALKRLAYAGVRVHGAVLNDVSAAGGKYGKSSYHYQYEYKANQDEVDE
jgi:tyrosine-protein kinase Etk/Wzc